MSNLERVKNITQLVQTVQPAFDEQAKIHGAVNFARESLFALQILQDSDFLMTTAVGDPDSLKKAILSVATTGLSLNPVQKLAYLVPRKKKICLDISYKGHVQIALDCGAVKWVAAEIVKEKDEFIFQGVNREPIHRFDPFGERGEIRGAYCLAKTHDGEFILVMMHNDDILSIRERSEAFKSGSGPWKTDLEEMIKKTVIRRASKSWPMTDTRQSERFNTAIDVSNELDFNVTPANQTPQIENKRAESLAKLRESLKIYGRSEGDFVTHLVRVTNRDLKKLEDLTEIEITQAQTMLNQFIAQANKAKEQKNENA